MKIPFWVTKRGQNSNPRSGKNPRPSNCIGTYLLLFHQHGQNIPVGGGCKTLYDLPPPLQVCSAHADEKVANMFLYNLGVADFFPVSDLNFDPFL